MCKETTRDLAQYSDFEEIFVTGQNVAAAQALTKTIGDSRLQVVSFNADDYAGMVKLFSGFDLVAGGQITGKGVLPPERALPVGPFFAELARRRVSVDEEIMEKEELV